MTFSPSPPAGLHLLDRRRFLAQMAGGLGGIALSSLLADDRLLGAGPGDNPLAPRPPHFPAKARRVVHIFCTGAVSHVDTFDYKPELIKWHGQPLPGMDTL